MWSAFVPRRFGATAKWRAFFDFFDFFVCFVGATVSLARLLSMLPVALVSFGTVTHRQHKQRECCN
jgi:hypothetical protein